MWLQTLALSNSAMIFLIYSDKIGDFRDAFVGILFTKGAPLVAGAYLLLQFQDLKNYQKVPSVQLMINYNRH